MIPSEQKVNPRKYCWVCAEKGHFAHECNNPYYGDKEMQTTCFVADYNMGNIFEGVREIILSNNAQMKLNSNNGEKFLQKLCDRTKVRIDYVTGDGLPAIKVYGSFENWKIIRHEVMKFVGENFMNQLKMDNQKSNDVHIVNEEIVDLENNDKHITNEKLFNQENNDMLITNKEMVNQEKNNYMLVTNNEGKKAESKSTVQSNKKINTFYDDIYRIMTRKDNVQYRENTGMLPNKTKRKRNVQNHRITNNPLPNETECESTAQSQSNASSLCNDIRRIMTHSKQSKRKRKNKKNKKQIL